MGAALSQLDPGERQAIAFAEDCGADRILLDDSEARREAERRKLPFVGTLGVLRAGSKRGLIDLPSALGKLQQTTFFVSAKLIQALLDEHKREMNA